MRAIACNFKGAMVENLNQPREYDAVLGGQAKTPANAAVLGGIEGIKRRLASAVEEHRIAALKDAPKYGEAGLDLVIQALQNESRQVESAAYRLLRERAEPRVKQILQEYNPWRLFERLYTFAGIQTGLNPSPSARMGKLLSVAAGRRS
jgi:COMPASS component SWD3